MSRQTQSRLVVPTLQRRQAHNNQWLPEQKRCRDEGWTNEGEHAPKRSRPYSRGGGAEPEEEDITRVVAELEISTGGNIDGRAMRALQALPQEEKPQAVSTVQQMVSEQGGQCRNLSSILQSVCRDLEKQRSQDDPENCLDAEVMTPDEDPAEGCDAEEGVFSERPPPGDFGAAAAFQGGWANHDRRNGYENYDARRPPAKPTRAGGKGNAQHRDHLDDQAGHVNFSVRLENVPREYRHDTFLELHEALGLEAGMLESSKLLPPDAEESPVCRALLRYTTRDAAQQAAGILNGEQITGASEEVRVLKASLFIQQKPTVRPSQKAERPEEPGDWVCKCGFKNKNKNTQCGGTGPAGCNAPRASQHGAATGPQEPMPEPLRFAQKAEKKAAKQAAHIAAQQVNARLGSHQPSSRRQETQLIYPSCYISDLPTEYSEQDLKELHTAVGLDIAELKGIKMLPPKANAETRACITRYVDDEAANKAVEALNKQPVDSQSGRKRFLGVAHARPAAWHGQGWGDKGGKGSGKGAKAGGKGKADRDAVAQDKQLPEASPALLAFVSEWSLQWATRVWLQGLKPEVQSQVLQMFKERYIPNSPLGVPEQMKKLEKKLTASLCDLQPGVSHAGSVKIWLDEKKFGWVALEGGAEVFVHQNVCDGQYLEPGLQVQVQVKWDIDREQWSATKLFGALSEACSLLVSGLPADASVDFVKELCSPYGQVVRCKMEESTGVRGSIALVHMPTQEHVNQLAHGLSHTFPAWSQSVPLIVESSKGKSFWSGELMPSPKLLEFVERFTLPALTPNWICKFPVGVQATIFDRFEAERAGASIDDNKRVLLDLAKKVNLEKKSLKPSSQLMLFAERHGVDNASLLWLSNMPRDVQNEVVKRFAPAVSEDAPIKGSATGAAIEELSAKTRVCLSNLPSNATREDVQQVCNDWALVTFCRVFHTQVWNGPRSAVVHVSDPRQADLCIQGLHDSRDAFPMQKLPLQVRHAELVQHQNASEFLFVMNLPMSVTEDTLREAFAVAGEILDLEIIYEGFGAHAAAKLRMASVQEAAMCIEVLDEETPFGTADRLSVKFDVKKAASRAARNDEQSRALRDLSETLLAELGYRQRDRDAKSIAKPADVAKAIWTQCYSSGMGDDSLH